MKKILLLVTLLSVITVFSQCFIEGSTKLTVGESQIYTLRNNEAQCTDCHHWTTFARNVTLSKDVKQEKITLTANAPGQVILSMDMLSAEGKTQCSKTIDVLHTPSAGISTFASGCDIGFEGFNEVKVSEGVISFVPVKIEGKLKYEWAADYDNGDRKTSAESTAQFNYSKENGIKTLTLKILSSKCMRNFTKTYDANYWKFY